MQRVFAAFISAKLGGTDARWRRCRADIGAGQSYGTARPHSNVCATGSKPELIRSPFYKQFRLPGSRRRQPSLNVFGYIMFSKMQRIA